jgi:hypothetical protein
MRCSADCITTIAESSFRYTQVVEPGQDIIYEYRWQEADGTWSSWRPTPVTGELEYPDEAREIQHRIAAAPACEAAN